MAVNTARKPMPVSMSTMPTTRPTTVVGIEIAVSDRRDRDERPPDTVPERFELAFVHGVLNGASDNHQEYRGEGRESKGTGGRQSTFGL